MPATRCRLGRDRRRRPASLCLRWRQRGHGMRGVSLTAGSTRSVPLARRWWVAAGIRPGSVSSMPAAPTLARCWSALPTLASVGCRASMWRLRSPLQRRLASSVTTTAVFSGVGPCGLARGPGLRRCVDPGALVGRAGCALSRGAQGRQCALLPDASRHQQDRRRSPGTGGLGCPTVWPTLRVLDCMPLGRASQMQTNGRSQRGRQRKAMDR